MIECTIVGFIIIVLVLITIRFKKEKIFMGWLIPVPIPCMYLKSMDYVCC